jgi:hypothetical protein
VPRYGSATEFLGAIRTITGEPGRKRRVLFAVDYERIIALGSEYCERFRTELARHLASRELISCSRQEWEAQQRPPEPEPQPQLKRVQRAKTEPNQ